MSDPFEGLPRKHYKAILADPPWPFRAWTPNKRGPSRGTVTPYEVMSIEYIRDLPINEFADENCSLFCWVVWPTLPEALRIIQAWGFEYKTCAFCWMKADQYRLFALQEDVRMGLGYWTRANAEVCLLATRGKPHRIDNGVRQGILEPIREHSRKPDCVYERIERLVAGPYLELFARQRRPGWDCWGNECDKFKPVEAVA